MDDRLQFPKTHGAWQSESAGVLRGTEGWVKYLRPKTDINGKECPLTELVYIHWNNPFVWSPDTKPTDLIDYQCVTSDVKPPCKADQGVWSFPGSGIPPSDCRHELFMAGVVANGNHSVTWWDVVMNWPIVEVLYGLGQGGDFDINLEFTIGLRLAGSVDQTIFSLYDGSKGLRSLANTAGQSSLRKLFRM